LIEYEGNNGSYENFVENISLRVKMVEASQQKEPFVKVLNLFVIEAAAK
jgi:hypothetical protein